MITRVSLLFIYIAITWQVQYQEKLWFQARSLHAHCEWVQAHLNVHYAHSKVSIWTHYLNSLAHSEGTVSFWYVNTVQSLELKFTVANLVTAYFEREIILAHLLQSYFKHVYVNMFTEWACSEWTCSLQVSIKWAQDSLWTHFLVPEFHLVL